METKKTLASRREIIEDSIDTEQSKLINMQKFGTQIKEEDCFVLVYLQRQYKTLQYEFGSMHPF